MIKVVYHISKYVKASSDLQFSSLDNPYMLQCNGKYKNNKKKCSSRKFQSELYLQDIGDKNKADWVSNFNHFHHLLPQQYLIEIDSM